MTSLAQLKDVLEAFDSGNKSRFYCSLLKIASSMARSGKVDEAKELMSLIDKSKAHYALMKNRLFRPGDQPVNQPSDELFSISHPKIRLSEVFLDAGVREKLKTVIHEQHHLVTIRKHGLRPKRKLLLIGPRGIGKSMLAEALSHDVGLPLCRVDLGRLSMAMDKSARLEKIFNAAINARGTYFFEGIEAFIGAKFDDLFSLLYADDSNSLLIASACSMDVVGLNVLRCFDDVLHCSLPDNGQIERMLISRLARYADPSLNWGALAKIAAGLCHDDVIKAADAALKTRLTGSGKKLTESEIAMLLSGQVEKEKTIR